MLLDIEPKYGSCNETYLGEGEGSAGAPRCCVAIQHFRFSCTKDSRERQIPRDDFNPQGFGYDYGKQKGIVFRINGQQDSQL